MPTKRLALRFTLRHSLVSLALTVVIAPASAKSPKESSEVAMAFIAGGTFVPGHLKESVKVPSFFMDTSEVSMNAYQECVKAGKCTPLRTREHVRRPLRRRRKFRALCNVHHPERGQHPVNCVELQQAISYCNWRGKRLPTDNEWEWAARGRDEERDYPWGDEVPIAQPCWYGDVTRTEEEREPLTKTTCAIGVRKQDVSRDQVFDLGGNVSEWTATRSLKPFKWARGRSPDDVVVLESQIIRGGSFRTDVPHHVGVVRSRSRMPVAHVSYLIGFRCVRDASANPRR